MTRKSVKASGGNVFEDLGFEAEEAAVYAMLVDLAVHVEKYIKRRGLNQTQAAAFFGMHQPRISNILNHRFDEISLDALVKMAAKTGLRPRITFAKRAA